MTEEVILLEPGDERAQKIAKAIASPTAGDILQSLKDGPKTSTDLTELLHLPMSTVKYHIENLLDAGIVEVSETRYSVKGREVKVYTLRDQLLIVAPRMMSIRSLLLKYASIFGVILLATFVVIAMTPLFSQPSPASQYTGGGVPATPVPTVSMAPADLQKGTGTSGVTAPGTNEPVVATIPGTIIPTTEGTRVFIETPAPTIPVPVTGPSSSVPFSPALLFFTGGLLVLAVVIIADAVIRYRK
jgi:DNA-binding transcriptional ArsR family regulator